MKRIFKFRYPKLLLLIIFIILAYFIFKNPLVEEFILNLGSLKYIGVFIAGMLFSFGFTSPFSAGFFIILNPSNILITALIGGAGAMISDLLIFRFIKTSFKDEFNRLKRENISKRFGSAIDKTFDYKLRIYLTYAFAGFLIASPLPDEAGVIMLSGFTKIKAGILAIIGFILNSLGILVLLYI